MNARDRAAAAQFTRMTHTLLESGYGLNEAIRLLSRNDLSPGVRGIAARIGEGIRKGYSLSASLAEVRGPGGSRPFGDDYISWVATAERTGNLGGAFASLNGKVEASASARKRLVSALAYPAFVIALSVAGTAILLLVVLPPFRARGFIDRATEVSMIRGIAAAFAALVALASGFATLAYRVLGRESGESLIFARFTDFARAGLPVPDAIPLSLRALGTNSLAAALVSVRRDIASGKALAAAFRDTGRFPAFVTDLMLIGADTGDLVSVFERARSYYAERDTARRELVLGASEPVSVAITGAYLAIVLESTVVPLLTAMGGIL